MPNEYRLTSLPTPTDAGAEERPMRRGRPSGHIRRPSVDEIRSLAAREYINLSQQEAADLGSLLEGMLVDVERLDDLPVAGLRVRYGDRESGYRPSPEEDPCNAFIRKCRVKGAPEGKLAGKTVGLKDNIRVAGVPLTNGSRLLAEYVPRVDATVTERLLDAGATIVGKLNMDSFGMGGTNETSDFGPVRNPHNMEYSAGGSSGGSGAALAAGEVDIALGVDEGGSARIPASWCGVVGIKPTHGLVPAFGLSYLDHTLDEVCPMAKSVREVALTLEAIAGEDPRDPQWVRGPIRVENYSKALQEDVSGLRLGVIKESMEWDQSEPDVGQAVWKAAGKLRAYGASVEEVSIPWWKDAWPVLLSIIGHSLSAMVESNLEGYWRGGMCDPDWQEAFGKARRAGSDGFPPLLKVWMVMGKYLRREYRSVYFSKAQNLRHTMIRKLDDVFEAYDVLATPTTPLKAIRLARSSRTGSWEGRGSIEMNRNTCPLNVTGFPALSVPCGFGDNGLPIGLQLISRRFHESVLFRVASQVERDYPIIGPPGSFSGPPGTEAQPQA